MLLVSEDKRPAHRTIEPVRPRPPEYDVKDVRQAGTPPIVHELHFHELVGILYRRRLMILTVAIAGTMLATVVGLLISPKYTATASIAVEPQQDVTRGRAFSPMDESPIDTQVAMLMSHDHLERVLDSLSQDPAFRSVVFQQRYGSGVTAAGPAGEAASQPANTGSLDDPTMAEGRSLSLKELSRRLKMWMGALTRFGRGNALNAEQLKPNLNVMQERRSRIVTVSFTSKSPQQAAIVANRMVQLYVDNQIEQMKARAAEDIATERERAVAEVRAEVAELALAAAARVVGETMNEPRERRLVEEFLSQVGRGGAAAHAPAIRLFVVSALNIRRKPARRQLCAALTTHLRFCTARPRESRVLG